MFNDQGFLIFGVAKNCTDDFRHCLGEAESLTGTEPIRTYDSIGARHVGENNFFQVVDFRWLEDERCRTIIAVVVQCHV